MSRAGREPAEDVKRRLVHACRAVDLEVATARMYLRRDIGGRLILVAASPPGWTDDHALISLLSFVKVDGSWSAEVDVRCSTVGTGSLSLSRGALMMQGRNDVPFEELVGQLRQTLDEREQVVAAVRLGIEGPYVFEDSRWETPACLL